MTLAAASRSTAVLPAPYHAARRAYSYISLICDISLDYGIFWLREPEVAVLNVTGPTLITGTGSA
jgi:hypothetical protein